VDEGSLGISLGRPVDKFKYRDFHVTDATPVSRNGKTLLSKGFFAKCPRRHHGKYRDFHVAQRVLGVAEITPWVRV
jgi:hypothetical protein